MAQSALRNLPKEAQDARRARIGMSPAVPQDYSGRDATGELLSAGSLVLSPVPVLGDLMGLAADARMYQMKPEERTMGNYALSALGVLPFVPSVAATKAAVRVADAAKELAKRGVDMSQAARMQRAAEQGYSGPYYHGTARLDRLTESGKIDAKKATSGPMPYFTDSPALASSYATGKADTSLPDGNYQDFFKVAPKDIGAGGRTPMTVERSWNFLDANTKNDIREKATRIGYENYDEASGPLTLHPSGVDASPSKSEYDYLMRTSSRDNPLSALRELWVDSGTLFNEEEKLADIYRLAGYPAKIDQSAAPWIEASGVMPAMLRMASPLNTSNVDELTSSVIPALKDAFKSSRAKTRAYGADMWDKNVRYTPKGWVDALEADIANNVNSSVWTSIPDKVTEALKSIGYDGIIDSGGKMGGDSHSVAIPFRPDQVRSINAAFDPAKRNSANLMAGVAGAGVGLSALRNINREEQPTD